MGQTPAKMFAPPLPYGQSPGSSVLSQAQAAQPAPQQNFLPLGGQPPTQTAQATPAQMPMLQGGGIKPNNIMWGNFGPAQRGFGGALDF